MHWNTPTILCVIAGGLAVINLIKPQWPLVPVAVLLVAIAVIVISGGHN